MLYSINYFIIILLVSISAKDADRNLLNQSQRKLELTYSNDTMNVLTLSRLVCLIS